MTLFPVLKRITEDTNVGCFDWLTFLVTGTDQVNKFFTIRSRSNVQMRAGTLVSRNVFRVCLVL